MARDILRAWLWLLALSLGSTAITLWHWPPQMTVPAGTAILVLAWVKARVILARYLGLAAAPFWRRGFELSLALFCLLLLALYLAPGLA